MLLEHKVPQLMMTSHDGHMTQQSVGVPVKKVKQVIGNGTHLSNGSVPVMANGDSNGYHHTSANGHHL